MRLPLVIVTVLLAGWCPAVTAGESITRVVPEPAVMVVANSAGAGPVERARSHVHPELDTTMSLVALIRLPQANSGDVVTVIEARRVATKITIKLETRRFLGALHANVVTTPVVEVALGRLAAGRYTVNVDEQVLEFTRLDAPESATNAHAGLSASLPIEVHARATSGRPPPAGAQATLTSTVTRATFEPSVVIAPITAGTTPEARYFAHPSGDPPANTPLVAIIRLPEVNDPDVVRVASVKRVDDTFAIAIETRRFTGILTVNISAVPFIEVELGSLPPATYRLTVQEQVLHFSDVKAPESARDPEVGLQASQSFTTHGRR